MIGKLIAICILFTTLILTSFGAAWASFHIHSEETLQLEIRGYRGVTETSLFQGSLAAGAKQNVPTAYRGLALLLFAQGQSYPVIIGDEPFTLKINNPNSLPAFPANTENDFFYKALSGGNPDLSQHKFALLMIEAKQLLDSTGSILTIEDLSAKKEEFHKFISTNYKDLKHSDMIRRLVAQYFMMHEYVDYHTEGAPATDIRVQYQKAVLEGVKNWLEVLKPHIPENEVLNYIVSLYYNRSMVALASLIVENFNSAAYCPGEEAAPISFKNQLLVDANRNSKGRLDELKGDKLIAYVSDDCPISMAQTVSQARRFAASKSDTMLIVAPLQELSEKHLSMNRMVSGGKMLFINDEQWRKENLATKIRLPLFKEIGATAN